MSHSLDLINFNGKFTKLCDVHMFKITNGLAKIDDIVYIIKVGYIEIHSYKSIKISLLIDLEQTFQPVYINISDNTNYNNSLIVKLSLAHSSALFKRKYSFIYNFSNLNIIKHAKVNGHNDIIIEAKKWIDSIGVSMEFIQTFDSEIHDVFKNL